MTQTEIINEVAEKLARRIAAAHALNGFQAEQVRFAARASINEALERSEDKKMLDWFYALVNDLAKLLKCEAKPSVIMEAVAELRKELDTRAEPSPTGTMAARLNWWKQQSDMLHERNKELVEALNELMAYQNGPPLIKWESQWSNAMSLAQKAISANQGKKINENNKIRNCRNDRAD